MSITTKIFWFFVVCGVLKIGLELAGQPPVNTYSTKEPVADMSREAQCSRGDTFIWGVQYGSTYEWARSDCKSDRIIKTWKM